MRQPSSLNPKWTFMNSLQRVMDGINLVLNKLSTSEGIIPSLEYNRKKSLLIERNLKRQNAPTDILKKVKKYLSLLFSKKKNVYKLCIILDFLVYLKLNNL